MNQASFPSDCYAATARPPRRHAPVRGKLDCDVCIVGAGYTGLSAALHLRERGYEVAIVEARQVGWGASGRNGGQLLSGYAPDMVELVSAFGFRKARRLWQLAESAKAEALHRAARLGVPFGRGWLAAATRPRYLAGLQREADCWRAMGYDEARLIGSDEIRDLVDSPLYVGGLLDMGAAHLHPLDYVRALAEAAETAGARLFEDSPALDATAHRVDTASATLHARHVLLCGNAAIGPLAPWLAERLAVVTSYVGVTEPLDEERLSALLPADIAVADSRFIPDFFRRTHDHRIAFGSGATYWRPLTDARPMLTRRLHQVFPSLSDAAFESVWNGQIAVTRSRLPLIGRDGKGPWHACGFSGHGVVLAGLAGRLLAEAVAGETDDFDLFASLDQRPFIGGPLRIPLLAFAMAWVRFSELL